tara:strand:+ start:1174 stop:1533 length:360 start_codon:yes stop_codon:yes gene_type:complete
MKFAIALAALLGVGTAPALAGTYANVESNASYLGNDYQSRQTDLHLGYENNVGALDFYVQGGPAFTAADGADGATDFSGKLGGSVAASSKLDVYGEVSFLTDETTDTAYGTKIGAKFKF